MPLSSCALYPCHHAQCPDKVHKNIQNLDSPTAKWPTLYTSVDGSFLTSFFKDKKLDWLFGGACRETAACFYIKLSLLFSLSILFCLLLTLVGLPTSRHRISLNTVKKNVVGRQKQMTFFIGKLAQGSFGFSVFAFLYLPNPFFLVNIWEIKL